MDNFISKFRDEPFGSKLGIAYIFLWFVFVIFIPLPLANFLNVPYSLQELFLVLISGGFGYLLYKHLNIKIKGNDKKERIERYKHIELEKTKWTKGMLDALPVKPESFYKDGRLSYDEFYANISSDERRKMDELEFKKYKRNKSYFSPQIPLFDWRDIEDFFDWNGLPAATFSPIEGGINGWFVNESGVWKEASAIEIATTGKEISKAKFKETFLEIINNSRPFDWDEVTDYYWWEEMPVVVVKTSDSSKAFLLSSRIHKGWQEENLDEVLSEGKKITEMSFFEQLRLYERRS